ncbi:MAG TPA: hypothetical protein PLR25_25255 [Planctomycetaceae bacterium]|nr:hypothetical protein [Planctomycetaceae bacterium]
MRIQSLEDAPSGAEYLDKLQREESSLVNRTVEGRKLHLDQDGSLRLDDERFLVEETALTDLARLARIPDEYFRDINSTLKAVNFNSRFPERVQNEAPVELIISNDNSIVRVQQSAFRPGRAAIILEMLLESVPPDTNSNDIRVIEYERDRRLDVAVISRCLETEPLAGDIVFGGVHLTIEDNGGILVGPENFRLACSNGSMARVCTGGQHRIRRGNGKHSELRLMEKLRQFIGIAWQEFEHVRKGLQELTQTRLDSKDVSQIVSTLRTSPFFVSAHTARLVEQQLRLHGEDLTLFDLHNAITYVGTHEADVLPQYRYRLRLGAGQLARGRAEMCGECRRLVIAT